MAATMDSNENMVGINFTSASSTPVEVFPCIVCSLGTNSIEELHNHQRYFHNTEELSLSIIFLVQHICIRNQIDNLRLGVQTTNYSTIPLSNNHYDVYNVNFKQDCSVKNDNANDDRVAVRNEQISSVVETEARLESANDNIPNSIIVPKECLQHADYKKFDKENYNNSLLSSLEIELNKVYEISDDTFVKSVEGICKQLKILQQMKQKRLTKKNHHSKIIRK